MGYKDWTEDLPSSNAQERIWDINNTTVNKPLLRELLINLDPLYKDFNFKSTLDRTVRKITKKGWWLFNGCDFVWVDHEYQTLTFVKGEFRFDEYYVTKKAVQWRVPVGYNDLYEKIELCQLVIDKKLVINHKEYLVNLAKYKKLSESFALGEVRYRNFNDSHGKLIRRECVKVTKIEFNSFNFYLYTVPCTVYGKTIKSHEMNDIINKCNISWWHKF